MKDREYVINKYIHFSESAVLLHCPVDSKVPVFIMLSVMGQVDRPL